MFLNTAKFKKQIKKAWEGLGVHITRYDDETYIIDTSWWYLQVKKDYFTKENMAAVVSIVGPLPEKGHAVLYKKGEDPQEEIIGVRWDDMELELDKSDRDYKCTNVVFRTQGSLVEVLQHRNSLEHILVPAQFIEMIDMSKCENDEEMYSPYGYSNHDLNKIFWASDRMILACKKRPYRWLGEKTFMEALGRINLKWDWTEEEAVTEEYYGNAK